MVGEIGQVVWSVQSVNYIHDFLMGVVVKYSLFPVLLLLGFTARRYGLVCVCVRASMPACDSGCHTLHQHLHHIHDPKSATILCTSWCAVHACAGHAHAHTHTHTHTHTQRTVECHISSTQGRFDHHSLSSYAMVLRYDSTKRRRMWTERLHTCNTWATLGDVLLIREDAGRPNRCRVSCAQGKLNAVNPQTPPHVCGDMVGGLVSSCSLVFTRKFQLCRG